MASPIRVLSGVCEINTGVFAPDSTPPAYQGEAQAIVVQVRYTQGGTAYTIPPDVTPYMYMYYDAQNMQTTARAMTKNGDTATLALNAQEMALPGAPYIVVKLDSATGDALVSMRHRIAVERTMGEGKTVNTISPEAIASAIEACNVAAQKATLAANRLSSVDMTVGMLPPAAQAVATVDQTDTMTTFALQIPRGDRGETGTAATLEITDVITGEPGTPAAMTEDTGSTAQARKYIVSIPKGDPGAVQTVDGIPPDAQGNVPLGAAKQADLMTLAETVRRIDQKSAKRYGIQWDRVNSQCTRLWDAASIPTTITNFAHRGSVNTSYDNPFDNLYPWSARKLCNVDLTVYKTIYATGGDILDAVTAWEAEPGFAYDGSNGAVMVYTPEFYACMDRTDTADIYGVSDTALPGWIKMPENIGGRYHGSADGSGGMTSIAGAVAWRHTAVQNLQRAAKTQNMTLDDVWTWCADTLLLCVEYATLNSQIAVGDGCSNLYAQSSYRPFVAETNANRIVAPLAFANIAIPGAVLDIGTSDGGAQTAIRVVTSVTDYPEDTAYKSVNFSGDPVNITTAQYISIHGRANAADVEIGSKSGYIGTNGKCNAYYRGRVAHANYYRYTLGAYRQTVTGHIWLARDRKEAMASETGLNTSAHIDTGLVLPTGAGGVALGAHLSALHFASGLPLSPFGSAATGGNSTNPVGDYLYAPASTAGNAILLAGAGAGNGAYCGRFCGAWGSAPSFSDWHLSALPFLISP